MASATTRPFNAADHLNSSEEVAAYLDAILEEGDDKLVLLALREVVKSRGFTSVARGALYQSFSEDGNPRLSTLHSVLGQLGMRLSVTPVAKSTQKRRVLRSPLSFKNSVTLRATRWVRSASTRLRSKSL